MFKFYLSFQINHKTHNWNKSQSLHHFLQGTTWHSPWLFLRGLTYNFPLPLFQQAHSHPRAFSLAGLSIWKSYSSKPLCELLLDFNYVSEGDHTHYSFSYYSTFFFTLPTDVFIICLPLKVVKMQMQTYITPGT